MKTGIQILLWVLCGVLAYFIYNSITGPIRFQEVKEERYSKVIASLKDIRNAQEAHKSVKGRYAKDFKSLVSFIDGGSYTITQQRDTSFMYRDERLDIDVPKDSILIDTLGMVSVRDSLFKKDTRYKTMENVPGATNGEKFSMKASIIDKGGYKAPVFEASVLKKVVLGDQPSDLLSKENAQNSVEEVNGNAITVGSMSQVSNSGNWPVLYDRKKSN